MEDKLAKAISVIRTLVSANYHSLLEATAWMGIPEKKRETFINEHISNTEFIAKQFIDSVESPEKLVRDKMPELCDNMVGWTPMTYRQVTDTQEHIVFLKRKLIEEAVEASNAYQTKDLVEELADLTQVMMTLGALHGITKEEVEAVRVAKRKHKGGFLAGIIWDGKR